MKKHLLFAALFLSIAFSGFSQRDPNTWTVENTGYNCTYEVCLLIGIRNTTTMVVGTSSWICNTIAPGNSATFSLMVNPATGYEIILIDAKATFGSTTLTGLNATSGTPDVRTESCWGGNWDTYWEYTGTHSFSIRQDAFLGE